MGEMEAGQAPDKHEKEPDPACPDHHYNMVGVLVKYLPNNSMNNRVVIAH